MTDTPHEFPNDSRTAERLTPDGLRALDSLVESGFTGGDSPAASKITQLLSLLAAPHDDASRSLLVDVTLARVVRASERDLAGRIHPTNAPDELAPDSARSLDELVRSGWRSRASGVPALLALLDPGAAPQRDRARLVDSTLGRVQRDIEASRARYRLTPDRQLAPARGGFRLTDLVALAAALLLAASVTWPMLAGSREQARDAMCAANLGRAAMGFSHYAADYRDALPQTRASFMGGTWWDVGARERSHSANLYLLVKGGYASLADLSCPGNAAAPTEPHDESAHDDWKTADEVSFSYQLPGPGRPGWNAGSRSVILADKSPVVRRSRFGEAADPNESSRNHLGRGQNILFSDASIRFYVRPVLEGGDNIWLPGSQGTLQRTLTGRETPLSDQDAFVGP